MPAIVKMQSNNEIERLEARIQVYEKMYVTELENIRRLNLKCSPHLALLTSNIKSMYVELSELKREGLYER